MPIKDFLFTSESVSEGHPDKMCDQISDAVLDALIAEDPNSRVALETLVKTGLIVMAGEITSKHSPDFIKIARKTATRYRLRQRRSRLQRQYVRGADRDRAAIARHLAGRYRGRGSFQGARRRRPGPDVRLCLRRNPRINAAADRAGPSPDGEPDAPAQGKETRFPAPRRQKPGDGALCQRPSGRRQHAWSSRPSTAPTSAMRPSARRLSRS